MNEPKQTHETPPAVGLGSSDLFGEAVLREETRKRLDAESQLARALVDIHTLKKALAAEKADHDDTQEKWNEALDTGLKVVSQRDALASLHVAAENLHLAIGVMLKDWRDGDFALPRLAEIHIGIIEEKYRAVGMALKAEDEAWEKFQREILSSPNNGDVEHRGL